MYPVTDFLCVVRPFSEETRTTKYCVFHGYLNFYQDFSKRYFISYHFTDKNVEAYFKVNDLGFLLFNYL